MLYIDIHTHKQNTTEGINIINQRLSSINISIPKEGIHSLGIHPWDTKSTTTDSIYLLQSISLNTNIIAIGECGLDRLKGADLNIQKDIFLQQAKLADKINKPLIIHCVKAFPELISIYKLVKPNNPWVIHGFNQNKNIARELIKQGIYLSFGSQLLNEKSNAAKIFSEIEKEYIFVETDESNIDIKEIYQQAAKLRNISLENLEEIIRSNYKKCFKDE